MIHACAGGCGHSGFEKRPEEIDPRHPVAELACDGDRDRTFAAAQLDDLRANHDCLVYFRQRVIEAGDLGPDLLDTVDAEVMALIEEAVAEAREAPRPAPGDVDSDVYINYAQGGA